MEEEPLFRSSDDLQDKRIILNNAYISQYATVNVKEAIAYSVHYSRKCDSDLLTVADGFVKFMMKRGESL